MSGRRHDRVRSPGLLVGSSRLGGPAEFAAPAILTSCVPKAQMLRMRGRRSPRAPKPQMLRIRGRGVRKARHRASRSASGVSGDVRIRPVFRTYRGGYTQTVRPFAGVRAEQTRCDIWQWRPRTTVIALRVSRDGGDFEGETSPQTRTRRLRPVNGRDRLGMSGGRSVHDPVSTMTPIRHRLSRAHTDSH